MPSTYSTNLGIELPADGELDALWGDVVNENMNILDRAINGSVTLSLSGTASTLTTSDGVLSNGQYKLLVLGGSPSGTHTITISPNDAQKIYLVRNTTAQSVVFTQGSGGNVTIAAGDSGIIYSNGGGSGAAVVNLTDDFAMSSVKITGGSVTGITDLAVADGGTGVSTLTGIVKGNGTSAFSAAIAGTDYLAPAAIGVTVQAWDANLDQIAALAPTDNNFIVGNGTAWALETPAQALSSLGVTATAAELNVLSGITASTTELNYVDGVTSSIQTQINNVAGVPTGAVMAFAMSSAPSGWLKANGALVSRTTYAALFAAIGTTFGAGDGSTTFQLPDLRGEFPRGWDDGRGVDSGRAFGSSQTDAFQGHAHNVYHGDTFPGTNFLRNNGGGGTGSGNIRIESIGATELYAQEAREHLNGVPRVANETRPRNVALLYCIKV